MKKWEECGWKRSRPTYFRWFSIHSIHPRLIIWFLNNLVFTVWGCQSHAQPLTWGTRVSLFVWLLPFDLSGIGTPTSSYATAGIGLRVSGAFKPHHHDKVETPSVRQTQWDTKTAAICKIGRNHPIKSSYDIRIKKINNNNKDVP
jgi:hypothetical protein